MNLKNKLLVLLLFSGCIHGQEEFIVPQSLLDQVENGNAESAYFIASAYKRGTEQLSANLKQAKLWMQKAAEMDYPQAMFELATMLEDEDNKPKALEWLQQAMQYGHSDAYNSVAVLHYKGEAGLEKDCKKAYELFETAMAKENKKAMNNYAWFLATSVDINCRNPEKALSVYFRLKAIYTQANQVIPWHIWDTESTVLAGVSDFSKAIENQKWLIQEMQKNDYDTSEYEKHLKAFEQRKAWIEK